MKFSTISIILLFAAVTALVLGYAMVGYAILAVLAVTLLLVFRVTIVKFIGEVRVELDKCSWPWDPNQTGFKKYKELRDSTVVVILSVVLLAWYVTTWDFLLAHIVGFLTGTAILK